MQTWKDVAKPESRLVGLNTLGLTSCASKLEWNLYSNLPFLGQGTVKGPQGVSGNRAVADQGQAGERTPQPIAAHLGVLWGQMTALAPSKESLSTGCPEIASHSCAASLLAHCGFYGSLESRPAHAAGTTQSSSKCGMVGSVSGTFHHFSSLIRRHAAQSATLANDAR
jgi:hypothetical protein